jgi:hypothetical protein
MLVIHPRDSTTAMLSLLYEGEEIRLLDQRVNSAFIKHCLNHLPKQERIMMLGHGSDNGLFSRDNEEQELFNRLMISHPHAYYLRKHGSNIVAVWCNADQFARNERLHGLFTGMIISELSEALMYHVATTQEELSEENVKLATRIRSLLDEQLPLHEIPARMQELDDVHSPLTEFNYKNFHYL